MRLPCHSSSSALLGVSGLASGIPLMRPGQEPQRTVWLRRSRRRRGYQDSLPWQELAQLRFFAFQPLLASRSLIPLLCVAEFTVVEV